MSNDIELLAQETLELSDLLREQKKLLDQIDPSTFDYDKFDMIDFFSDHEELSFADDGIPEGPGLVLKIDKAEHTFCIRGFTTSNLKFRCNQLKNKSEPDLMEKLRISAKDKESDFFVYQTDNINKANVLYKNMLNRRFPLEEDLICNLSDPGFSWWYEQKQGEFSLYFKSHGIDRASKLVQLGPMGDIKKAKIYFNNAFKLFGLLFPIEEFACTSKALIIKSLDQNSDTFFMLQDLFVNGINHFEYDYPFNTPKFRDFWYYLDELALFRHFWLSVQDSLAASTGTDENYLQ